MNKKEISDMLVKLGCNKSLKGFDMFVDLISLILEDFDKNPHKTKYNAKDYYYQLSIKYDVKLSTIPGNIRTAVTTSNIYGDGLNPKDVIDMILKKEKKRGNN